ncbi:MAG: DUF2191 domain-containing protein [Cytophagaceae bacterium BCCC1]|jgi:Arc/MetJ family transcription regulator|nr:MAG: DUF2191 domain-containing protein [Cytophagaceae bacterium BCCC1]
MHFFVQKKGYFRTKNFKKMAINIDINQEKLAEIMSFKQFKSKKQAVNTALDEYLKILVGKELLKLEGSNAWEGDLDKMRLD